MLTQLFSLLCVLASFSMQTSSEADAPLKSLECQAICAAESGTKKNDLRGQQQQQPYYVQLTLPVGSRCRTKVHLNLTRTTLDTAAAKQHQHRLKTSPQSTSAATSASSTSAETADDGGHQHVSSAPVLMGERGRVLRWNISHDGQTRFALYEDIEHQASFARINGPTAVTYMGSFIHNGTMYSLRPHMTSRLRPTPYASNFSTICIDNVTYRLSTVAVQLDLPDVAAKSGNARDRVKRSSPSESHGTAIKVNYTVNLLVVVDYAIYYRWYMESMSITPQAKRVEAMRNIVYYYTTIISGVNMRYMSINEPDLAISVRFAGIYTATTPTDSPFTEGSSVKIDADHIDPYQSLKKFGSYATDTLQPIISFDQATLFTANKLLVHYVDGSNGTISGLSHTQGICQGNISVAISHEGGEYSSIQTTAHELGHNLGANHDGIGNNCSSGDQFIMAAGPQYLNDGLLIHPFNFSSCSIKYFKTYLSATTASCLLDGSHKKTVRRWSNSPGQRYNPDKQCQIIHGSKSFYCAGGSNDRNICREMKCWVPAMNDCHATLEQRAFDGTTCGHNMSCYYGQCLHAADDANAAATANASLSARSCLYGDYRGSFTLEDGTLYNCSAIGAIQPWRCYDAAYSADCCMTCQSLRNTTAIDCEYGDNDWSRNCYNISRGDCYDASIRQRCCETCAKMADNAAPLDCQFGDRASWCDPSHLSSFQCYTQVSQTCCLTCSGYFTGNLGCEFGDRVDWCKNYTQLNCSNAIVNNQCCDTCQQQSQISQTTITIGRTRKHIKRTKQPHASKKPKSLKRNRSSRKRAQPISYDHKSLLHMNASQYSSTAEFYFTTVSTVTSVANTDFHGVQSNTAHPEPTLPAKRNFSKRKRLKNVKSPMHNVSSPVRKVFIGSGSRPEVNRTRKSALKREGGGRQVPSGSCPRGDGAPFCSEMPRTDCYFYSELCCATCSKYYITQPGCEYGDKVDWCSTYVQGVVDCSRSEVSTYCCKTCSQLKQSKPSPVCSDKATWCDSIFPGYCYDVSVESTCCAKCSKLRTNNADCYYGDRFSWCNKRQYCGQYSKECCSSCQHNQTTTT